MAITEKDIKIVGNINSADYPPSFEYKGAYLKANWDYQGQEGQICELEDVFVPQELRRQGIASIMMIMLTNWADKHNITIELFAQSTDDSVEDYELVKFYRNFRFESHGDYDQCMAYQP